MAATTSPAAPAPGALLPDEPRWLVAHGLAGEPTSWRRRFAEGELVGDDRAELAVVLGRCRPAELAEALAARPPLTLLCADDEPPQLASHVAGLALLHTLAAPLEALELEVARLRPDHAPPELPEPLRAELRWASERRTVWAVWVESRPVSFAYACWRSPAWFDVSVHTLPGFRQLGLAELVARAAILAESGAGRAPVWVAPADHQAAQRLAARLGFAVTDQLWMLTPRGPR